MSLEIPASFTGCPVMNITGANAHPTYTHVRAGCRGIVRCGDEMLISHELNSGWYLIPGGGLEEGERLEACCLREIEEETGVIAQIEKPLLCLREHYEDWLFISYYFLCSPVAEGQQALTDAEKRRGLVAEWLTIKDALAIFARHEEYAATSEEKRGSYQREYTALKTFCEAEGLL